MTVESTPVADMADHRALRSILGVFATGVTVLTVGGEVPHGMTANSFTAVSLDPPLVLFCVGREALMHSVLLTAPAFGVSVLAADQEPVARYFANRHRPVGVDEFASVDWLPGTQTGAPLIVGAAAHFECVPWRTYDGGDHTIFLGRLLAADSVLDEDALLFLRGRFHHLRSAPSDVTA
ncbi:flavin reductase family protein [Micromonospora mangrovi]|uniref:Flavin reductase family protein n=2 Tax=Micromonospora TaxID=1873 RepID=A0AAU8HC72_9ACTN